MKIPYFVVLLTLISCKTNKNVADKFSSLVIENQEFYVCPYNPFGRFGAAKLDYIIWKTKSYVPVEIIKNNEMKIIINDEQNKIRFINYVNNKIADTTIFAIYKKNGIGNYIMRPGDFIKYYSLCNKCGDYKLQLDNSRFKIA